jgi:hypothetical protein
MSEPHVEQARVKKARVVLALLAVAGLLFGAHGCASQGAVTRLADGSYRVDCERPLLPCLEPAAKLCEATGYDVITASEQRNRYGPSPWQLDAVKSSATVRCRNPSSSFLGGLFDSEPAASASSARPRPSASVSARPAPAPPAPAPPAPGCVPGTSQACAAVSGCSGAQVCSADGRSFGPCECMAAAPPPPVVADAGAP